MQDRVFVKNPTESKFMASVVGLSNVTADGVTEKEAICQRQHFVNDKLKVILDAQFKNGKLVTIDIDVPSELSEEKSDPLLDNMGVFQDDPTFDDFLLEVNNYRNEVDLIEDRP